MDQLSANEYQEDFEEEEEEDEKSHVIAFQTDENMGDIITKNQVQHRRILQLFSNRLICMNVEVFNQIDSPMAANSNDVSVTMDQCAQFSGGDDDVEFWNVINQVNSSRKNKVFETLPVSSLEDCETNRLASFLQASTTMIEKFIVTKKASGTSEWESNPESTKSSPSSASLDGVFDSDSSWLKFASTNRVTANELLVNRPLIALKCSRLEPNLFLTAHAYPANTHDQELDLKPYRVCLFEKSFQ